MLSAILAFLWPPLIGAVGGVIIFIILDELLGPSWFEHAYRAGWIRPSEESKQRDHAAA